MSLTGKMTNEKACLAHCQFDYCRNHGCYHAACGLFDPVPCDCGGEPHGKHCAAVVAGAAESPWTCPECGQHAGNCSHPQP